MANSVVPAIPTTHRAWTFTRRGPVSETLQLTTDYPTPQPASLGKDEALVKVSAVSFNAGQLVLFTLPHLTTKPWIPELEFAGTIVALGHHDPSTSDLHFQVGDRVLGVRSPQEAYRHNGTLQEYLVASLPQLAKISSTTTFADASGLGVCGCTSIQALRLAGVKSGGKVLITGGSSGLGTLLVQVAKALVGEAGIVVATTSGKNQDLVRSLGADETIDYTKHKSLVEYMIKNHSNTPFDAIFDIVSDSNDLYTSSPAYLTESGKYVLLGGLKIAKGLGFGGILRWVFASLVTRFRPLLLGGTPRHYQFFSAAFVQKDAQSLLELVEAGKVRAVVDSRWNFDKVHQAYERIESQRAQGKVVIEID